MFDKRIELTKFLVVAETGTMLAAADKLSITQSALSRLISKLEGQFGGQLFERSPAGVRLTQFGALVAEQARHILKEIDIAEFEINARISGRSGHLSITADYVWAQSIIPSAVADFQENFPDVDLDLRSTNHIEGLQLLVSGDSDIHCGNITAVDIHSPLILCKKVQNVVWGILSHESHPLQSTNFDIDDLVDFPWVDFGVVNELTMDMQNLSSLACVLDDLYRKTNRRTKSVIRSHSTGMTILRAGLFLSYLPLNITQLLPELALKPLPTTWGRNRHPIGIAFRRSANSFEIYHQFHAIVKKILSREVATRAGSFGSIDAC